MQHEVSFKSKLDRHLNSDDHKFFAESMSQQDEVSKGWELNDVKQQLWVLQSSNDTRTHDEEEVCIEEYEDNGNDIECDNYNDDDRKNKLHSIQSETSVNI